MLTDITPNKSLALEVKLANGDQLSLAGELSIEQIIHLTLAIKSLVTLASMQDRENFWA